MYFFVDTDVRKISDVTGRQVEPWEVAYFNGAAILDEIPVSNRDQTDQVVFRDRGGGGLSQLQLGQVGTLFNIITRSRDIFPFSFYMIRNNHYFHDSLVELSTKYTAVPMNLFL